MKQNQSLFRSIPGSKPEVKQQDFLKIKARCACSECERISHPVNPEIALDYQLMHLRLNNKIQSEQCDLIIFLNHLKKSTKNLPKFRFLDTIVLQNGQPSYAIYFQGGKLRIIDQINIKNWIIGRKESLDLKYQIKKHERENDFRFTSFEHKCEKKIKQFENNIKYKIPAVLNKTAIIKLKHQPNEAVMARSEFLDMFDITKNKAYDMKDIEYIQVFPVMHGEEHYSYTKTIKYFRNHSCKTRSYKLAEAYVSTWRERNDSIEKLEEKVYDEIKEGEGLQEITEDDKLLYQSFKLLIYFEEISNIRIEEAILHYITNDNGKSFFFKKIECMKIEKRSAVDDINIQKPTKKEIAEEDHINLKVEMRKVFDNFQSQFERLDKQRLEMENRVKKDNEYSNYVFKTVANKRADNLHQVLMSGNLRYKRNQLGL